MTNKKGRWSRAEKQARKERLKRIEERKEIMKMKTEVREEKPVQVVQQQMPIENKLFEDYYVTQGIIPQDELEKFVEHTKKPLPYSFRLSSTKSNAQELLHILKRDFFQKLSEMGPEEGVILPPTSSTWFSNESVWQMSLDDKVAKSNKFLQDVLKFLNQETECGNIVRQDVVSMLPALLLDVKPHHKVLDLRSSPGYRATHLVEYLYSDDSIPNPDGLVIANETHLKRCYYMSLQIKQYFSPNFAIVNMDANNLPSLYLRGEKELEPVLYDRIVCGFPSSGDGMFRHNLDGLRCWTANVPLSHHGHLTQMLYSGLSSLAIGGRLMFSIYSMNPVEAEAVVYTVIMQQRDTVELEDISNEMPDLIYEKGLHSWKVMAKGPRWFSAFDEVPEHLHVHVWSSMFPPAKEEAEKAGLDRCVRILPHKQDTMGLFIAVFRRKSSLYEAWQREQEESMKAMEAAATVEGTGAEVKDMTTDSVTETVDQGEKEENMETVVEQSGAEEKTDGNIAKDDEKKQNRDESDAERVEDMDTIDLNGAEEKTDENTTEDNEENQNTDESGVAKATDAEGLETGDGNEEVMESETSTEKKDCDDKGKKRELEDDDHNEHGKKQELEDDDHNEHEQQTADGNGTMDNNYLNSASYQEEDGTRKANDTEETKKRSESVREGPFHFLDATNKIWLEMKDFYGFTDNFPFTRVGSRYQQGVQLNFFFVSETIKKLVEVNQPHYSFAYIGIKVFTYMKRSNVSCPYRLAQAGLSQIVPYMTKRVVTVSKKDFISILSSLSPSLEGLDETAKQDVMSFGRGSFVFVLEREQGKNGHKCKLMISAWKDDDGATNCRTFIPEYQRLHYLRLIGANMSDYVDKPEIQEFESAFTAFANGFDDLE